MFRITVSLKYMWRAMTLMGTPAKIVPRVPASNLNKPGFFITRILQLKWCQLFIEFCEDFVGFFEGFLGADVVPQAGNAPGIHRRAGIKPLNEAARLVGIIALGNVLPDKRERRFRIIIQSDTGN